MTECWNDKNNRRQNLQNATAIFNDRTGCDISSRTVCRRFVQYGNEHRVFSKKITIYPVNHKRWLGFCRRKWHWTVQNQWSSVIFSDETKIVLGQTHKVYVWKRPDERMRPDCLGLNDDCETNSVHRWCSVDEFPTIASVHWFLLREIWTLKNIFQY